MAKLNLNKQEVLRAEIASRVLDFWCEREEEPFQPGITPVSVTGKKVFAEDLVSTVDSVLDAWFTGSEKEEKLERAISRFIGMRGGTFVNSGSSANLLAISALTSPKLGKRALKPGDEVITLAMGFPTTVAPIIQNNCVPVFIDCSLPDFGFDKDQLVEAIGPKTKAIIFAHTLGMPFDAEFVRDLCNQHNLWMIEDTCDALGAEIGGMKAGSFGDLSTISFYPAHHITAGEGGMVLTKSPLMKKIVESFRDWGRDCYCDTGVDNTCQKRFEWQLGSLPAGYDHKYIYTHRGYNLKASDMQAALGLSQFTHLQEFIDHRRENYVYLAAGLDNVPGIHLAKPDARSEPSWFGFPILVDRKLPIATRNELVKYLESRRIGTRLLFGGNLLRHPAFSEFASEQRFQLGNSDIVMNHCLWVGVHPSLTKPMLDWVITSVRQFFEELPT